MGKDSAISWTHHTFNAWWGCSKVSPGCANCYAAAFDKRLGGDHWKVGGPRKFFGDKHWDQPIAWYLDAKKRGVRERVFCSSMADVFERHPDPRIAELQDDARRRLWSLILTTRDALDWLLLTKRPENFRGILPWDGGDHDAFPFPNVWLGVTAENQEEADRRIPILLATDAARRFVSCEPLLERVTLTYLLFEPTGNFRTHQGERQLKLVPKPDHGLDWVIAGCESGAKARACEVDWLRGLRDECAAADVAFHLKQAEHTPGVFVSAATLAIGADTGSVVKRHGKRGDLIVLPYLDGVQHAAVPE